MKHFKGIVKTTKFGSGCEFEFDVEDNATPEDIEKEEREAALQHVEWWSAEE